MATRDSDQPLPDDYDLEDETIPTSKDLNRDLETMKVSPDRAEAVISLVLAGASYQRIAKTLDFPSAAAAKTAAEKILASTVTETDRNRFRTIIDKRLEKLHQGVYRKAADPRHPEHLAAARLDLAVIDRTIKLHGLDAPTEINVNNPSNDELQAWVAKLTALEARKWPEEPQIVDAQTAVGDDIEDAEEVD